MAKPGTDCFYIRTVDQQECGRGMARRMEFPMRQIVAFQKIAEPGRRRWVHRGAIPLRENPTFVDSLIAQPDPLLLLRTAVPFEQLRTERRNGNRLDAAGRFQIEAVRYPDEIGFTRCRRLVIAMRSEVAVTEQIGPLFFHPLNWRRPV